MMRYAVWEPQKRRYVTSDHGLAWTRDRKEADETAAMVDGVVVDAALFSKFWALWQTEYDRTGELPAMARLETARSDSGRPPDNEIAAQVRRDNGED